MYSHTVSVCGEIGGIYIIAVAANVEQYIIYACALVSNVRTDVFQRKICRLTLLLW